GKRRGGRTTCGHPNGSPRLGILPMQAMRCDLRRTRFAVMTSGMSVRTTGERSRGPMAALLGANAISKTGNVASLVAIPRVVLPATGSASRTGITAFAGLVPVVLSGIFGGALVDRVGNRRMSVLADLASAAATAAIPLLHTTAGLAFWQLVALVFV